ncbi:MAG: aldehyde dehydrogenase family protein [Gammaproteobacteria bacterium]|nr:aldehyde dehydrogenase family protein [Gammaproteobacteria bacterium]MCH9763835.1 aldehyde dehydrogenase family protein [Gammaproteobacteria bacterium]
MKKRKSWALDAVNPGAYSGYDWTSDILKSNLIASYNPATEDRIAEISGCTADDYDNIMQRAHQAFLAWRKIPAPRRGDIIRQIGDMLRHNKDSLGTLISLEVGKSKQEGDGEVQEMIDMADFAVGQSRMLYGKTMHSERPEHRLYEQWHPLGVIGVISAFNFPGAVWAWNAFIGAICGNVMVWKPSRQAALSAIVIHKLCAGVLKENQAPAIFSVIIPDSHGITESMLDDKRLPLISFTGSTVVGKQVASRVAARLGRSILELGGNNAMIIDETANLKQAIPAIIFGAVGTAGQRCTTTRRLFVHSARYDEVLTRLKKAYAQITIGMPLDEKNLMGPLINRDAVVCYERTLREIKASGGSIAFGGKALDGPGYFVQPTLVTGLQHTHALLQQEVFAPILYLIAYDNLDEGIQMQNDVPQGLSSALFTENFKHAEHYLSALGSDCGISNINLGTSGAEIGGAFGGEKETGGGRESGSDAWKGYMRRQTNTLNWGDELPFAQGIVFKL